MKDRADREDDTGPIGPGGRVTLLEQNVMHM
jgi:hypothetical protein